MASKYGKHKYGANKYSSSVRDLSGVLMSFTVIPAGHITAAKPMSASLSFSFPMTAKITELELLQGTLPVSVTIPTNRLIELERLSAALGVSVFMNGSLGESEPLTSNLTFAVSVAGRLVVYNHLSGNLPFTVTVDSPHLIGLGLLVGNLVFDASLAGLLHTIHGFRGGIDVDLLMLGILKRTRQISFAGDLPFQVIPQGHFSLQFNLSGDLPFEVLIGGGDSIYLGPFWDPDDPVEDSWTPDTPNNGPWVPDTPVEDGWTPDTPNGGVWTAIPDEPSWSN